MPRKSLFLLLSILALSAALDFAALDWGLPNPTDHTWSFDELHPRFRGHTPNERHGGRYPPLHYDLLRTLYAPFRWAAGDAVSSAELDHRLRLAGRSLSALMGVATVGLVYAVGRRLLLSTGAALFAALATALSVPLVRFSKTINLDVPYLFWFTLSLLLLARILERHRWADYLALAVTMAFAIGTKDQAAALYTALPLILVPALAARRPHAGGRAAGLAQAVVSPRLLACLGLSLLVFAIIHRLFTDPAQFRTHLDVLLASAAPTGSDSAERIVGPLWIMGTAVRHVVFSLGLPLFLAALAGVGLAVRERRSRLLGLLLMLATYALVFLAPIPYHLLRYFLPTVIVLSLFAGLALHRWSTWARLPLTLRVVPVALLLLYSLALPVCLNARMIRDSRYGVERWLAEHLEPDERWIALGDFDQLTVRGGRRIPWERVIERRWYLEKIDPDYIVVNPEEAPRRGAGGVLAALESGDWNYSIVLRTAAPTCERLLDWSHIPTNLFTVDPPLLVLRRAGDRELAERIEALIPGEDEAAWASVARELGDAPVLAHRSRLGPRTLAFGLHENGWTRGSWPATLLLSNPTPRASRPVLRLRYPASVDSPPQRVTLSGPNFEQTIEIEAGQAHRVRLPALAPGEERALVVRAARAWRMGEDGERTLGVRVDVRYPR